MPGSAPSVFRQVLERNLWVQVTLSSPPFIPLDFDKAYCAYPNSLRFIIANL